MPRRSRRGIAVPRHLGDWPSPEAPSNARVGMFALAIREARLVLDLEVRARIHTGEIEVRADDVAGLTVHIGAGVSGLAAPGEVLVSSTVKDVVVGSSVEFAARGEHEPKGVQVRGDCSLSLRSAAISAPNLVELIGNEFELTSVAQSQGCSLGGELSPAARP